MRVCAISCHFASGEVSLSAFFKMLWRGLGMLARSTGKQLIITSFCKKEDTNVSTSNAVTNMSCLKRKRSFSSEQRTQNSEHSLQPLARFVLSLQHLLGELSSVYFTINNPDFPSLLCQTALHV